MCGGDDTVFITSTDDEVATIPTRTTAGVADSKNVTSIVPIPFPLAPLSLLQENFSQSRQRRSPMLSTGVLNAGHSSTSCVGFSGLSYFRLDFVPVQFPKVAEPARRPSCSAPGR
jgi:hypothetical protein